MPTSDRQVAGTHYTDMPIQPLMGGDGTTDPRDVLSYDPLTGEFRWLATLSSKAPGGSVAGWFDKDGYRVVTIKGRKLKCHRLAWWWMTGSLPREGEVIDHINRVPDDNRFANLRLATRGQNAVNRGPKRNSQHQAKGVVCYRRRWRATVFKDGKKFFDKHYDTKREAIAGYNQAAQEAHGEFYCHSTDVR